MEDKLKQLLARCKCGVFITVNEHRNYYRSARDALAERDTMECPPEIAGDVRQAMIETDTIICVHVYPDSPVGSYEIYHHDIAAALTEALACLK